MFQPSVPVFDGHVCLGRRHDQRVGAADREEVWAALAGVGTTKALVCHPHAVFFDTRTGNRLLRDMIADDPRFVPQFVVNLALDDPAVYAAEIEAAGVRSLRAAPRTNLYPFAPWVADPWLEWMSAAGVGLWLPIQEVEAREVYDTVCRWPQLRVVLVGVHYSHHAAVWPLLRALPQVCLDLSHYDIIHGVERLLAHIGPERLLYGSGFPELAPGPYLSYLHQSDLPEPALRALCGGNLERLLAA
jgi:hypothetical protein